MCLPFSLSSTPRVFTKILHPVVGFLCSKGIRCVIYLDDILLDQDRTKLIEHAVTTLLLLEALGFLVNYPKSDLDPTQEANFPRLHNQFNNKGVEPSTGKDRSDSQRGPGAPEDSAQPLAQLIGKTSAALLAIQPAPPKLAEYQTHSIEEERV